MRVNLFSPSAVGKKKTTSTTSYSKMNDRIALFILNLAKNTN